MRAHTAFIVVAGLFLASCAQVGSHMARHDGLPADVGRFLDRRSACAHFSADSAGFDDTRDTMMMDQSQIYCTGSDSELASLRAKYAANAKVIAALDRLEADIEQSR